MVNIKWHLDDVISMGFFGGGGVGIFRNKSYFGKKSNSACITSISTLTQICLLAALHVHTTLLFTDKYIKNLPTFIIFYV